MNEMTRRVKSVVVNWLRGGVGRSSDASDDDIAAVSFAGARVEHFFYFDAEDAAHQAATVLQKREYETVVTQAAGNTYQTLLLAGRELGDASDDPSEDFLEFEALAEALVGRYDGWEVGPLPPDGR